MNEDDDGTTVLLSPLRPLRADARHGIAMTRAVTDVDEECFAPSPTMQEVLLGTADEPRLTRLEADHAALVDALRDAGAIVEPTDLSAAIVFTTATTTRQSSAIAAAIASSIPSPVTFEECLPIAGGVRGRPTCSSIRRATRRSVISAVERD